MSCKGDYCFIFPLTVVICMHSAAGARKSTVPCLIDDFTDVYSRTADLEQSRSPGLLLNLPSNNPFRNRTSSHGLPSPSSPFDDPPPRPTSRNPFLDPGLSTRASLSNMRSTSENFSSLDKRPSLTAEDIFVRLVYPNHVAQSSNQVLRQLLPLPWTLATFKNKLANHVISGFFDS